ncbi:MAG TPA: phage portal protein [Phycisphaerae bacterium]|nr:phage portal protein [Phycisphaerae bacterium]
MWPFKRKAPAGARIRLMRAKFDSAQTTYENRNHWLQADNLSAGASVSPGVRQILRSRARYEVANNSYARGIVLTLANDVIGTGPRLQMLTKSAAANSIIEAEFLAWSVAVDLAGKLRTMRMARAQDGEAFAILSTNDRLPTPVKLDLRLVEADQVALPSILPTNLNDQPNDGIEFDEQGNPISYQLLVTHPGDPVADMSTSLTIPAASMLHWFRADRAGQTRGAPDITPALPLFAQLRRYTLAVLESAETVANMSVIMKTPAPAGGAAAEVDPTVEMELSRNSALFMPEGWEPYQIKAEQPTTTYAMFKSEILNEVARCLNMPYNIAAGNSASYNYASGRLDHQMYFKSIRVDQAHCEAVVLDRILTAWLYEAQRVLSELPTIEQTGHQWFWEGREHVDPAKEATAQATRLSSNTTTLAVEYARQGRDWETELRQRAKEAKLLKRLGLTPAQAAPAVPVAPQPDEDEDDEQSTPEEE